MAKVQKSRITANQFDQALIEEITHARAMNVQTNMVSNAVMFSLMLRKRLYGDVKMIDGVSTVVARLMNDAKAERAEYEIRQKEAARQQEQQRNRVIIPGDPRFRN
jgi:adenosyl cobinamide kinase/adenosyl cobinamide phosphate guanylyltransferase